MRKTNGFLHESTCFFYCFDRRSVALSTQADHMISQCTMYVGKSVGILMEVSKHFDVVSDYHTYSKYSQNKRVWQ